MEQPRIHIKSSPLEIYFHIALIEGEMENMGVKVSHDLYHHLALVHEFIYQKNVTIVNHVISYWWSHPLDLLLNFTDWDEDHTMKIILESTPNTHNA